MGSYLGKLYWPNGVFKYEGVLRKFRPHGGKVKIYDDIPGSDTVLFEGEMFFGCRVNGFGVEYHCDRSKRVFYRGEYRRSGWHGQGCRFWNGKGGLWIQCDYVEGKRHGFCREYFESGMLAVEARYKNGNYEGSFKKWFTNGKFCIRGGMSEGRIIGFHSMCYDNGQLQCIGYQDTSKYFF